MTTEEKSTIINEVLTKIAEAQDKIKSLPPSRENSTAITKLDEARMWVSENIN